MNLNVYAYCQRCGRGFDGPEKKAEHNAADGKKRRFWPFGSKAA
ncbi:MAG: hypothetical protein ABI305_08365 [Tepidiformaceae bacterium]